MRVLRNVVLLGVCAFGAAAVAQDFARLSDAEAKQVNAWMADRAQTMIQTHKLENELQKAWADERYTSSEIEKLRARYRELQHEMSVVQLELQKKVQEVPAVQEKARQLDETKKKEQELSQRIAEKAGKKQ